MRSKLLILMVVSGCGAGIAGAQPVSVDPYTWLEEVASPKAMDWVNAHNARSTAVLEADPRYAQYYKEALAIAEAKDRIPIGNFIGGPVYNFRQDADHILGFWCRATIASYSTGKPEWETVLDLDALATAEKANWAWHVATCGRPAERRCLISLSDGGEDADTVREFDLKTKEFVKDGFVLPKGKQSANWENENTLLVSREWKPGELGRTGYPYIAKRLRRGQPLSAAVEVYRGSPNDGGYGVTPYVLRDSQGHILPLVQRPIDTFTSQSYALGPKGPRRIGIPAKAQLIDMLDGRVIIQSREDWR